jgi:CheY-like chemotaxis protein
VPGPPTGPLILVADDAAINQLVARRMLERLGCQVDVASTGREALEALERQSYALVLMDVQMPEMDGLEAATLIRQREACSGQHTPIVAMTANAMIGDGALARAAGMDDYLSKPIRLADLEVVLRNWARPAPQTAAIIDPGVHDGLPSPA